MPAPSPHLSTNFPRQNTPRPSIHLPAPPSPGRPDFPHSLILAGPQAEAGKKYTPRPHARHGPSSGERQPRASYVSYSERLFGFQRPISRLPSCGRSANNCNSPSPPAASLEEKGSRQGPVAIREDSPRRSTKEGHPPVLIQPHSRRPHHSPPRTRPASSSSSSAQIRTLIQGPRPHYLPSEAPEEKSSSLTAASSS